MTENLINNLQTFLTEHISLIGEISNNLVGTQVIHSSYGQGCISGVEQRTDTTYILVRFVAPQLAREEKQFLITALVNTKFFISVSVDDIQSEKIKADVIKRELERKKQEVERKEAQRLEEEKIKEAQRILDEKIKAAWKASLANPVYRIRLEAEEHVRILIALLEDEQTPENSEKLWDELYRLLLDVRSSHLWHLIPEQYFQNDRILSIAPGNIRIKYRWKKLLATDCSDFSDILADIKRCLEEYPLETRLSIFPGNPNQIYKYPILFSLFPAVAQVKILWDLSSNDICDIWSELSQSTRLYYLYRCAREKRILKVSEDSEKDKLILAVLKILNYQNTPHQEFSKINNLLQDYVISQAWNTDKPLLMKEFLPECQEKLVLYCEVKAWPTDGDRLNPTKPVSRFFCPRGNKPCRHFNPALSDYGYSLSGARFYANDSLDWPEWSALELFKSKEIVPVIDRVTYEDYVPKFSGWVNRLNEIRNRLRCSACNELMRPDMEYSRSLASYNTTVVSCRHGMGHDTNIYFNHCWACRELIDSRESRYSFEKFHLCIHCGSGPQKSLVFTQGDTCPNCGREHSMVTVFQGSREMKCKDCNHVITLPPVHKLTGDPVKRADNYRGGEISGGIDEVNWGNVIEEKNDGILPSDFVPPPPPMDDLYNF